MTVEEHTLSNLMVTLGQFSTFRSLIRNMSNLADYLWKACSALGLRIELGYRLTLSNGRELISVARIADVGAPEGMLLFRTYGEVRDHIQTLRTLRYGYSVIDEPRSDEEFDLESFKNMFRDWGWSGPLGKKPQWM